MKLWQIIVAISMFVATIVGATATQIFYEDFTGADNTPVNNWNGWGCENGVGVPSLNTTAYISDNQLFINRLEGQDMYCVHNITALDFLTDNITISVQLNSTRSNASWGIFTCNQTKVWDGSRYCNENTPELINTGQSYNKDANVVYLGLSGNLVIDGENINSTNGVAKLVSRTYNDTHTTFILYFNDSELYNGIFDWGTKTQANSEFVAISLATWGSGGTIFDNINVTAEEGIPPEPTDFDTFNRSDVVANNFTVIGYEEIDTSSLGVTEKLGVNWIVQQDDGYEGMINITDNKLLMTDLGDNYVASYVPITVNNEVGVTVYAYSRLGGNYVSQRWGDGMYLWNNLIGNDCCAFYCVDGNVSLYGLMTDYPCSEYYDLRIFVNDTNCIYKINNELFEPLINNNCNIGSEPNMFGIFGTNTGTIETDSVAVCSGYNMSCAPPLAECTENWSAIYTNLSCNISDFMPEQKLYLDLNYCGTTDDLPIDNGTISTIYSCNYCSEDINEHFTSWGDCVLPEKLQDRIRYYVDDNFGSCCDVTGLLTDCHINNGSYDNASEQQACQERYTNRDLVAILGDGMGTAGASFIANIDFFIALFAVLGIVAIAALIVTKLRR